MQHRMSRAVPTTSSTISTASGFLVDRRPPPDLGKCANCKRFIWNEEKHTFLNRTCGSWCKLIFFYSIFLALLLGLFVSMMLGCTHYIKTNFDKPWIPKQPMARGGNPGMGFVPNNMRTNSPLLWYTESKERGNSMHFGAYVKNIDAYLKPYDEAEKHQSKYRDCSKPINSQKLCLFKRSDLGPCGRDTFGYADKKPCIYIKINKMPEWIPEFYNGDDLPDNMPQSLKMAIKKNSVKNKLWIHCEGMFPADQEHLGAISYYPDNGISGQYFPYSGSKDYLSPLVAIKADNIRTGYVVNIRCSLWAKNIKDSASHSTYIQLYVATN